MTKSESTGSLSIDHEDHSRGREDAPVTVIVYGDFECPHTRQAELALARLRRREGPSFRTVFRHFPLRELHPHAQMAAEASEVVFAEVGAEAFWQMHDALFGDQLHLELEDLEQLASRVGVDPVVLRAGLETRRFVERIERDVRSALANGVGGTPAIFINGERYRGARSIAALGDRIREAAEAIEAESSSPIEPHRLADSPALASDEVDEASLESFPASDPPSWDPLRAGPPS